MMAGKIQVKSWFAVSNESSLMMGAAETIGVPYNNFNDVAHMDASLPISHEPQAVHDLVLAGNYNPAEQKHISFFKYVDIDIGGQSPVKRAKS